MPLRHDLTDAERARAIDLVEEAAREPAFRLAARLATWSPASRSSSTGWPTRCRRSIFFLLAAALLVMAATLALVFRTRLRLLPLLLALGAAALTYGGWRWSAGRLTMASIAVLPVLIGLAVDYAIQFQARWDEQRAARQAAARRPRPRRPRRAGRRSRRRRWPPAAGFLVLLLSPVPMVRDFGAMLVVGIVLAFGVRADRGLRAAGPLRRPPSRPTTCRRCCLARARVSTARAGPRSARGGR